MKLNGALKSVVQWIGIGLLIGMHYMAISAKMDGLVKKMEDDRWVRARLVKEANFEFYRLWRAQGTPEQYRALELEGGDK